MKFGAAVVYIENGVEYNATFFSSRQVDDLGGADDEPLIHLGFFKEVFGPDASGKLTPKNVIGTSAQDQIMQIRLDVAHESHSFTEEQKKRHHLSYGGSVVRDKDGSNKHVVSYPGGRWREPVVSTFTGTISENPFEAPALGTGEQGVGSSPVTGPVDPKTPETEKETVN